MATCPQCGKELAAEEKFCAECGATLNTAAASMPTPPAAQPGAWSTGPAAAPTPLPVYPQQGYQQQSYQQPNQPPFQQPQPAPNPAGTQTGLQKNVAALLCYVLGWVTGLIFYFVEKDKFVRFHAVQSIIVFGGLQIIQLVLGRLIGALSFGSLAILGLWGLVSLLISIGQLVLWILLMVKAYNNQVYKLPFVGDLAEKYSA